MKSTTLIFVIFATILLGSVASKTHDDGHLLRGGKFRLKIQQATDRLKEFAAKNSHKIQEVLNKIAPETPEGTLLRGKLGHRIRTKIAELKEKHGSLEAAVKHHVEKAKKLIEQFAPAAQETTTTPEQGTLLRKRLREHIENAKHIIHKIKNVVAQAKEIHAQVKDIFHPAPAPENGQELRRIVLHSEQPAPAFRGESRRDYHARTAIVSHQQRQHGGQRVHRMEVVPHAAEPQQNYSQADSGNNPEEGALLRLGDKIRKAKELVQKFKKIRDHFRETFPKKEENAAPEDGSQLNRRRQFVNNIREKAHDLIKKHANFIRSTLDRLAPQAPVQNDAPAPAQNEAPAQQEGTLLRRRRNRKNFNSHYVNAPVAPVQEENTQTTHTTETTVTEDNTQ